MENSWLVYSNNFWYMYDNDSEDDYNCDEPCVFYVKRYVGAQSWWCPSFIFMRAEEI